MAITAATRTDIIELVVLATGGAPGTTLLSDLVAVYESSNSLADVAASLTASASFKATYPTFATPAEFGGEFLDNILPGLDAAVKAEGVAVIEAVMNGGASRADVLVQAAAFLSTLDTSDAAFGSSAALFQNQVAVATYHTVELELDTNLTGAISGVTSDPTTVDSSKGSLDGTGASAVAYTEAQAAADAAITAATEAAAPVADVVAAYEAAAATAAETDADALKAVSDASTAAAEAAATAKTNADAAVVTAQAALNTAIASGDANAVSTANGNLIIAQSAAATAATNAETTAATAATDLAATEAAQAADAAAATAAEAVNTLNATLSASTAGADAIAAAAAASAAADAYAADAAKTTTTTDDAAAAAAKTAAAASVTAAAEAAASFDTASASISTTATAIAQVGLEATAAEALAAYNTAAATAAASLAAANTAKTASDAAATAANASDATITQANAYVTAADALVAAAATASTDAAAEKVAADALKAATDATTTTTDDAAATSAVTTSEANVSAAATLVTAGSTADTASDALVAEFAAQSFTLTSATNLFTGGKGNDTFTSDTSTLTAADVLKGGIGVDTLSFTGTSAAALPAADISEIEVFNIRQTTGALSSTDLSQYAGVTNVNLDRSTQAATFTNMPEGGEYGVIGNGTVTNANALAIGYVATTGKTAVVNWSGGTLGAQAVTLTGTAITSTTLNSTSGTNVTGNFVDANTSKTLNVNGTSKFTIGTIGDSAARSAINLTSTDGKLTTGAITSAGTASTSDTVTVTANNDVTTDLSGVVFEVVNVSGTGKVALGTLNNSVKTFTSTQTAGTLSAQLGTLVTQTVTLGAEDDTITTPSLVLTTGSVNAGAGNDKLIIGTNVGNVNTTSLAAKYTNFETLSLNGTLNIELLSGITAIELSGATNNITNLTAEQAANVTATADIGASTIALKTATGTSDALTLKMGTGLTTAAATDAAALTITGFETLNLQTNHGPSATTGANRTSLITAAIVDANLTAINLTGSAFNFSDIATTKAVTIDATALVGDGATSAKGLTVAGSAKAGSTIKGSEVGDTYTIGAEGSTYNGNGGADSFTTTVAILTADGTTDLVVNGGDGTDTLTISDASATVTDNQFTFASNFEKLTLSGTGTHSLTTGSGFNSAFSSGATVTTGTLAATNDVTVNAGLATVKIDLTVDATSNTGASSETHSITTGSGDDKVTFTGDASWVGVAGAAQGTIAVSTGTGADTIKVTIGTLVSNATSTGQAITITGGAGVDSIEKVGTNGPGATGVAHYVMASGDSVEGAYDTITGFDVSDGTYFSDGLDFSGTVAVGTLGTSTDKGVIKSHSITAGIASFDDADAYAAALVINSSNLGDVIDYLQANSNANGVIGFTYDSNGDGTADATFVYHNTTVDDLVLLAGVTAADAIITTNAAGANDLFVF